MRPPASWRWSSRLMLPVRELLGATRNLPAATRAIASTSARTGASTASPRSSQSSGAPSARRWTGPTCSTASTQRALTPSGSWSRSSPRGRATNGSRSCRGSRYVASRFSTWTRWRRIRRSSLAGPSSGGARGARPPSVSTPDRSWPRSAWRSADQLGPDVRDLLACFVAGALVVDHAARARTLVFDGHLRGDDCSCAVLAQPSPLPKPADLCILGHVDEQYVGVEVLEPVLKQQGHVLHNDGGPTHQRIRRLCGHPFPHERMDDRIEARARIRVVEDELAKARAVDLAVADVVWSELGLDQVESEAPWFVDGVSGHVRIQHHRAEVAKHRRDRRLARPGAARQPNELQFV